MRTPKVRESPLSVAVHFVKAFILDLRSVDAAIRTDATHDTSRGNAIRTSVAQRLRRVSGGGRATCWFLVAPSHIDWGLTSTYRFLEVHDVLSLLAVGETEWKRWNRPYIRL